MSRVLTLKPYAGLIGILMLTVALLTAWAPPSSAFPSQEKGFVEVVKRAKPAVVHVRVEKSVESGGMSDPQYEEFFNNPFFERFFGPQFRQFQGPQRRYKQQGQGSGFIISNDGYILTNNHVVDGADTISVILSDNRKFTAELIGADPQTDVALIKIKDSGRLPTLPLGDSDALEVGEWVIAIGNPFGLSQTVTAGVVSATGRSSVGINEYEDFIQTDAAINPGNSGGPLINSKGEVVGINSALYSRTGGYMGIGFAIPINMVKEVETQLKSAGKVTRGWLGVVIQNLDEDLARSFGLESAKGILVSDVQPGSPAANAGIEQGDVIVKLNGIVLHDVADLRNRVAALKPDSDASIELIRNGKTIPVEVNIGQRPNDLTQISEQEPADSTMEQFGLTLQNLTPEVAERLGYDAKTGVVVSEVEPGSPAFSAGMRAGQLIEEANKKPVRNLREFDQAAGSSKDSKRLLLRVRSGNFSQYVVLIAN